MILRLRDLKTCTFVHFKIFKRETFSKKKKLNRYNLPSSKPFPIQTTRLKFIRSLASSYLQHPSKKFHRIAPASLPKNHRTASSPAKFFIVLYRTLLPSPTIPRESSTSPWRPSVQRKQLWTKCNRFPCLLSSLAAPFQDRLCLIGRLPLH